MNQLYQKPFPHSYDDNLINSFLLKEIKENWPKNISSKWDESKDVKVFRLESSESWLEMNDNQIKFWKNFIKVKSKEIIKKKFDLYKSFFEKKFNEKLEDIFISAMGLTEFGLNPNIKGPPHCHFNEGVWLFTILIHIEDKTPKNSNYNRGNTIFSIKSNPMSELAKTLSKYPSAKPDIALFEKEKKTIPFQEGRVFSFLETSISYHGFDEQCLINSINNPGKRKMIRIHVSAPENFITKTFKFSDKESYRRAIDKADATSEIIKFYENDLNNLKEFQEEKWVEKKISTNIKINGVHNTEIAPFFQEKTVAILLIKLCKKLYRYPKKIINYLNLKN